MHGEVVPLLTIVTVTRNDAEGLRRTQQSIRNQSGDLTSSVEWLVIDGGDDPSAQGYAQFASDMNMATRVEWHEPAGIYAAMNAGLASARGQFIYFLNAGDAIASSSTLLDILKRLSIPRPAMWLVGQVRIIDQHGRTATSARWTFSEERDAMFARGVFPPHQGTIVRTQTLREIGGFDTRYRIAADYHAALKLSVLSEPQMLDTEVAEFYEGGTSTVHWKRAAVEFHRARLEVFAPSGVQRIRDALSTARIATGQFIYRDVLRRGAR